MINFVVVPVYRTGVVVPGQVVIIVPGHVADGVPQDVVVVIIVVTIAVLRSFCS